MKKVDTVLLIDDNLTTTFMNSSLIQKLNIAKNLLTVRDGKSALQLIKERVTAGEPKIDLILLDIKMPIMDGFEFFEKLKETLHLNSYIPNVVVLTTSLNDKDIQRASQEGILHYFCKPLTIQKLQDIWVKLFE